MAWTPIGPRLKNPRSVTGVDRKIGERVRDYRNEKNLSIEYVSRKLGISWQMLQKYELGRCRLSVVRLLAICDELGVPPNKMLEGL